MRNPFSISRTTALSSVMILLMLTAGFSLPLKADTPSSAAADPLSLTGAQIMDRMAAAGEAETAALDIRMTLADAGGRTSVRRFQTLTDSTGDQTKTITVFLSPESVANTRFLTISAPTDRSDDSQWIYLPALGKVKRISAGEQDTAFMGSDFTYADMDEMVSRDEGIHTLLRGEVFNGFSCAVVESVPRDSSASAYGRTITWVDTESWMAVRVLFYEQDRTTLRKELICKEIAQTESGRWYTKTVEMETQRDGHRTTLDILQVRYGMPLNPGYFTTFFLETGKVR